MFKNSRLVRASKGIERRIFLKALGLGLSLPLAARLSRIASAASGPSPKRFLLLYMPHGVPPEHYNPQVSAGDRTSFALDQSNISILSPLEKYKSYVNVYQGFKYPGATTHEGIVSCLSGITTSNGGSVDESSPRTTLEHVIAKGLGVTPLILGACSHRPYGLDKDGKLFWNGTAVDPQKNPAAAADKLFASKGPPSSAAATDADLRKQLLALTASEIDGLQRELGSLTREKTKLQRHLEAVQSLQNGGGPVQSSCTTAPVLPTVEMVRSASAGQKLDPSGGNDYFYQEKNFPLLFQAQLELAAQAIVCNAAQVVAVMPMYTTCDFDFAFAQAPGSHHTTLSHTGPQPSQTTSQATSPNNFNPTTRANFAKAQLWFAEMFDRYVLAVLAQDDPSAPGQKILDNTLIYWMSEIGDGAQHSSQSALVYPNGQGGPMQTYLPLVSIGKSGGALKTGQVVRFDADRPAGDLYLSFCRAMGVASATFGDAMQPVQEVLA
jgi:hypothetical protein